MNAPTRILDTMTELHRFLFCSAHAGHGQWLSAALREEGVVLQEAGRPAQLQQRIGDLDPQVVLLDFSGEPTGPPTIALTAALRRRPNSRICSSVWRPNCRWWPSVRWCAPTV